MGGKRFGTVYWFTGLSGAGKTTIGRLFHRRLKGAGRLAVILDGDNLREVFGDGAGHTIEERKSLAMRYGRLCRALAEQGVDVVCATISMFRACRAWNRRNIRKYREIYLRVPMNVLIRRDQKRLYSRALKGRISNVMGIDLPFEEPEDPDVVIDNDGSSSPKKAVMMLAKRFRIR